MTGPHGAAGSDEEREHDLSNTLLAFQTAVHTLDRFDDELASGERAQLVDAIDEATVRLQCSIEAVTRARRETFSLSEVVAEATASAGSDGPEAPAEASGSTLVSGDRSRVLQILDGLLDALRTDGVLRTRVERDPPSAVVHVDVRGRRWSGASIALRLPLADDPSNP